MGSEMCIRDSFNGTFVLSAAERSLQLRLEERLLTAAREGDNSELKKLVGLIYISYFPPVSFNDNIFVFCTSLNFI